MFFFLHCHMSSISSHSHKRKKNTSECVNYPASLISTAEIMRVQSFVYIFITSNTAWKNNEFSRHDSPTHMHQNSFLKTIPTSSDNISLWTFTCKLYYLQNVGNRWALLFLSPNYFSIHVYIYSSHELIFIIFKRHCLHSLCIIFYSSVSSFFWRWICFCLKRFYLPLLFYHFSVKQIHSLSVPYISTHSGGISLFSIIFQCSFSPLQTSLPFLPPSHHAS